MKQFLFLALTLLTILAVDIQYPIRFGYINTIKGWWPPSSVLAGMAVPGYAKETLYNHIALTFWGCNDVMDMVKVWSDPITYLGSSSGLGRTKEQVQRNLKKKYNDGGVKILISAFGSTEHPTSANIDPIVCANKLGNFVLNNNLDGVDVDWEDNAAMEAGRGEEWLIKFTKKLRSMLPGYIITQAPQAPYFKADHYKNRAYIKIHEEVGDLIDFYNVQFYNQGDTKYNDYTKLFKASKGWFPGTSVEELIKKGIPKEKIVVGKPATRSDVMNSGYVSSTDLGSWTSKAFDDFCWFTGVMFWQYKNDDRGIHIKNAVGDLIQKYNDPSQTCGTGGSQQQENQRLQIEQSYEEKQLTFVQQNRQSLDQPQCNQKKQSSITKIKKTPFQNKNVILNNSTEENMKVHYPVRMTSIDHISKTWPPEKLVESFAVPPFASNDYNFISIQTWTYLQGAVHNLAIWQDAVDWFTSKSQFGSTTDEIQKSLKKHYDDENKKILVTAFGNQNPSSHRIDPVLCAKKLATFVIDNNLHGVNVEWRDIKSIRSGTGENWLILFMKELRIHLSNHIVVHTATISYFSQHRFTNGGYITVHKAVGHLIDFYNIQYFQISKKYKDLFTANNSISVQALIDKGIPSNKIIVGKTVLNVYPTGYVDSATLGSWTQQAYDEMGWYGGVSLYHYFYDQDGTQISEATNALKVKCKAKGDCN